MFFFAVNKIEGGYFSRAFKKSFFGPKLKTSTRDDKKEELDVHDVEDILPGGLRGEDDLVARAAARGHTKSNNENAKNGREASSSSAASDVCVERAGGRHGEGRHRFFI